MSVDASAAEQRLIALRWPRGVACPSCGSKECGRIETRSLFRCRACRSQFSARKGTIFEDSPLSIEQWFAAIESVVDGSSSSSLAESIGATQKTAWLMQTRIRAAMEIGECSARTFDSLARQLAQVPKEEVDKKVAKDKAKRIAKRRAKKK